MLLRKDRRRLILHRRKLVHIVVKRSELALPGVANDLIEAAVFGLAGEE